MKESEQANAVYNFKIDELTRQVETLKSEKKFDPEMELKINNLMKENEDIKKVNEKLEFDLKERENLHSDLVQHLKEEGEQKLKDFESKVSMSQGAIDKVKVETDMKVSELKKEISVLQQTINRLNSANSSLELQLTEARNKSSMFEKQTGTIKNTVNMDQKSNIFGTLLKKSGEGNKFLKEAQKEAKNTEQVLNIVWKDKIDDLKKLRENIIRMTPKTVSSRSIPDDEYQNIDFDDEEKFKKMQEKLQEREKKHLHDKERLAKLKEEMEQKKEEHK